MEDFGERGFGLGSQVSQIDALMLGNGLDHFIKEQLRIRGYGRYMDDGYLICEDVRYLEECAARIRQYCADIGLQLSEKKTRILPIRQGVRFLKTKFKLTQTGGVIRKVQRKSTRKMRQKLRKFRRWVDDGRMTEEDVRTSYESWKGHMRRGTAGRCCGRRTSCIESCSGRKETINVRNSEGRGRDCTDGSP